MKVLIVSGFLGAGKTTFIKELIRRTGTFPVIMENEYGENDIDARELGRIGDMKILEFMEGCVCCTMKDSFINSVLTVSASLDPEYLIVEPTGVGKLSSIIENVRRVCYEKISLLQPIAVISPRTYAANMAEWPELYGDQVRHARRIVFSKGEHEPSEVLEQTEAMVRRLNPHAEIVSRHYTGQSDEWWRSLLDMEAGEIELEAGGEDGRIEQLSLTQARLSSPRELIMLLEDCLRGELGHMARAKGNLYVGGELMRFDLADGLYAVSGSPDDKSQCVFIGEGLRRDDICRRLNTSLAAEAFSPGAPRRVPQKRKRFRGPR